MFIKNSLLHFIFFWLEYFFNIRKTLEQIYFINRLRLLVKYAIHIIYLENIMIFLHLECILRRFHVTNYRNFIEFPTLDNNINRHFIWIYLYCSIIISKSQEILLMECAFLFLLTELCSYWIAKYNTICSALCYIFFKRFRRYRIQSLWYNDVYVWLIEAICHILI